MSSSDSYCAREEMIVRRSNEFLCAKYQMPLIANKIMAIALCKIEAGTSVPGSDGLTVQLYPGEINKLLHRAKSNQQNIYRDIRQASIAMTNVQIVIEDEEKRQFEVFALVPNIKYLDGVLTIQFNQSIRRHVLDLKGNYSQTEIAVLSRFKRASTYRLYEFLSKERWRIPDTPGGYAELSCGINELRFMIGLANTGEKAVMAAMSKMKDKVDWDYLYDNVAKEKMYEGWAPLRTRVIEPAQKELEMYGDIAFDYDTIRKGHNCVKSIKFYIRHNTPKESDAGEYDETKKSSACDFDGQMDLCGISGLYDELEGVNMMTRDDISLLYSRAGGDASLVRQAVEAANKVERINNWMGWLIAYIERGGYDAPTATANGDAGRAVSYDKMMENIHAPEVAYGVWEKAKARDDFAAFTESMGYPNGDMMELFFSIEECVKMYCDWKTGQVCQ